MKALRTLLAVALAATFVACGQQPAEQANDQAERPETQETPVKPASNSAAAEGPEAPTGDAAMAAFAFENRVHDFGEIDEGEVVEHTFTFVNEGKAPLVIDDIKTSCGCTTPSYTKDPVAPGAEGSIDVRFNSSGKKGKINKTVTVNANVPGGKKTLTITGTVNKQLDGPYR